MVAELVTFFNDLELNEKRVRRPQKFLFLCGGALAGDKNARPKNLRDYIFRIRALHKKINIVLAERAEQLYRDSGYGDLISFEEDIARIASVVMIIAESPGSLAELGAFTANDTIQSSVRVIIQKHYHDDNSFVRYGPVERLRKAKKKSLAVYPWKSHANGTLNVSSTKPHYSFIAKFAEDNYAAAPNSTTYNNLREAEFFFLIYWIVYLCLAVTLDDLGEYVRLISPDMTDAIIGNKLYSMKLAGWIEIFAYDDEKFVWALHDQDPFDYVLKPGVVDRSDTMRRRMLVQSALRKKRTLPPYVSQEANRRRLGVKP